MCNMTVMITNLKKVVHGLHGHLHNNILPVMLQRIIVAFPSLRGRDCNVGKIQVVRQMISLYSIMSDGW